jgi:hypothetical protein
MVKSDDVKVLHCWEREGIVLNIPAQADGVWWQRGIFQRAFVSRFFRERGHERCPGITF